MDTFLTPRLSRFFKLKHLKNTYSSLFSVGEIEKSTTLQMGLGASLLMLFVSFSLYIRNNSFTVGAFEHNAHLCWPHFLDCGKLYLFNALPIGYSHNIFFMLLFAVMVFAAYRIWQRKWVSAHMLITSLWIVQALITFVFTIHFSASVVYYQIVLTAALLFLPHKLFFFKFIFVLLYFLSATIKFHEGWIAGTFFTSLQTGLPLIPDTFAPIATWIVIISQTFGAWLLLSQRLLLQRIEFFFLLLFHLYSGIFILFWFPLVTIPYLLIFFGPLYEVSKVPLDRKSLAGWTTALVLICLQLFPFIFIPGDQKYTLEGSRYGLFLFDANRQCIIESTVFYSDGSQSATEIKGSQRRSGCDPYLIWFRLTNQCQRLGTAVARIEWKHDLSINGGSFYRVVDVPNVCDLKYRPFSHNEWIRTPDLGASAISPARKNIYPVGVGYDSFVSVSYDTENEPPILGGVMTKRAELTSLQRFIIDRMNILVIIWWLMWLGTLVVLFLRHILIPLTQRR